MDYPNQPMLQQTCSILLFYFAEGCGRISLVVNWTHATGQSTYAWPIPSPSYQFGDARDLTRGVQSGF